MWPLKALQTDFQLNACNIKVHAWSYDVADYPGGIASNSSCEFMRYLFLYPPQDFNTLPKYLEATPSNQKPTIVVLEIKVNQCELNHHFFNHSYQV